MHIQIAFITRSVRSDLWTFRAARELTLGWDNSWFFLHQNQRFIVKFYFIFIFLGCWRKKRLLKDKQGKKKKRKKRNRCKDKKWMYIYLLSSMRFLFIFFFFYFTPIYIFLLNNKTHSDSDAYIQFCYKIFQIHLRYNAPLNMNFTWHTWIFATFYWTWRLEFCLNKIG